MDGPAAERNMVRGELIARYGEPTPLPRADRAGLLRLFGRRADIHPYNVLAALYPSMAAAEAYAQANREVYGHDVLGPIPVPADAVAVTDLRRELAAHGCQATDPGLPDDWTPPVRHRQPPASQPEHTEVDRG